MKEILFAHFVFLLIGSNLVGQETEMKILTLSKGKYIEIENNDSLQRIGSVVVNMYTGDLYELLDSDTLYTESELHPTIITRFWTIDPLAAKYPSISPYAFVSNSPIINKEIDGRDFIPVVDHVNHTITIKAVYYVDIKSPESIADAKAATEYWNAYNDKYIYQIKDGNQTIDYDIKFELTVEEVENPELSANAYTRIESKIMDNGRERTKIENRANPGLNLISTLPREDFTTKRSSYKNANERADGFCVSYKYIYLPEDILANETIERAHEVGHSLGMGHMSSNTMGKNDSEFKDVIDYRNFTSLLISARILTKASVIKDYKEDISYPTPLQYEETGTVPANFNIGTVKKKK